DRLYVLFSSGVPNSVLRDTIVCRVGNDYRNVGSAFGHELVAMVVVIFSYVLIRWGFDPGIFLVVKSIYGQLSLDLLTQRSLGHAHLLELFLVFILGQPGILFLFFNLLANFGIVRRDVLALGLLEQDFSLDEIVQDTELKRGQFGGSGWLICAPIIQLLLDGHVDLLHFDLVRADPRGHVAASAALTGPRYYRCQHQGRCQESHPGCLSPDSAFHRPPSGATAVAYNWDFHPFPKPFDENRGASVKIIVCIHKEIPIQEVLKSCQGVVTYAAKVLSSVIALATRTTGHVAGSSQICKQFVHSSVAGFSA